MARRPFHDEPMSKVAVWSSRLALFAFAVAALSIIIVRSGLLEIVPALATFAAALIFAGLAVLLSFAAFVVIWRQGVSGLGRALLGLFLGLALLAYPAYLGTRALMLPDDIRHHHGYGQSPALRRPGASAATRAQQLSRPGRGRASARRLPGCRAA